jgi:hypothetical protein
MVGCGIFEALPPEARVRRADTDMSAAFFELFYRIEGLKSGMHHPEGMLWIRRPGGVPGKSGEQLALETIAPTVLSWFKLEPPAGMRGQLQRAASAPSG